METRKAHNRRLRDGWYGLYLDYPVLDVGGGGDPIADASVCTIWDKKRGNDAHDLSSLGDASFGTVYASHVLEHLDDPTKAIREWWRVLKPNGYLIVVVPHRDLYERRTCLPSRYNPEHQTFWLPYTNEPPCTFSLRDVIADAINHEGAVLVEVCDEGFSARGTDHAEGEYSIEAIVRKAK